MFCEKCGAQYDGKYCPNGCNAPAAPQDPQKKKPLYKKWWFWLIVAIVVFAVAGGGDSESSDTPSGSTPQKPPASTSYNNTETQKPTSSATAPAEDNVYHSGDIINANGLKITYVKAEKWTENNQFLLPDEGYMYIRLYLSVENTSDSDKYISSFEFTCYADGKKEQSVYLSTDALEGGTLSSGRKDEGYIYFMVPENAKEIEVEYETSFWTSKKAILKVEL